MNKKRLTAVIAGLAMCVCLASCGDSDSSQKTASSVSEQESSSQQAGSQGADSTGETDASSQEEYDPNGDVRLYDSIKEQYAGNYKLTAELSVNGGDAYPVIFEVKDDLRYSSATVMGMQTNVYITAEGEKYVINEGTTTYDKYEAAELGNMMLKSPQYDPLFAATGSFVKASVDGDVINEEYTLDFDGLEGSIIYSFDNSTRALTGVQIKSDDMDDEVVSNTVLSAADHSDFELPDISGYTRNN